MTLLQTLIARWESESPALFQKITRIGIGCTAAGTAALATPLIPGLQVPEIITKIGGHLLVTGFIASLISKLTCQDPSKLDTSLPPKS